MKLLANTYQVSYHEPILWPPADPDTNINAYPKHMRVRATNAVAAIDFVHANLVKTHNHPIITEEATTHPLKPRFSEEMLKFFEGRSELRFQPVDFPIMEVKVVA